MTAPQIDQRPVTPDAKAGHTPGEWAVDPIRAQVVCETFDRFGGRLPVTKMLWPTPERSEAETFANARLISAAPDLLEAVQALLAYESDDDADGVAAMAAYDHALTLSKAAIRRALGDGEGA